MFVATSRMSGRMKARRNTTVSGVIMPHAGDNRWLGMSGEPRLYSVHLHSFVRRLLAWPVLFLLDCGIWACGCGKWSQLRKASNNSMSGVELAAERKV